MRTYLTKTAVIVMSTYFLLSPASTSVMLPDSGVNSKIRNTRYDSGR